MTEDEFTKDYLSKFPTILRNAFETNSKYKKRFLNRVETEYEDLTVYRALHRSDAIMDDDFICNIEEAKKYNRTYRRESLELYAISVNEDPSQIIKALSIPNVSRPALGIAKGKMKSDYGPADFVGNATHHNWYLYEQKIPLLKDEFEIVDIDSLVEKEDDNNERYIYMGTSEWNR